MAQSLCVLRLPGGGSSTWVYDRHGRCVRINTPDDIRALPADLQKRVGLELSNRVR